MVIQSIQGTDEINKSLTNSMLATLDALVKEKCITEETAKEFAATHVCLMVDNSTIWSRLWATIGFPTDKDVWCPTVFKLT